MKFECKKEVVVLGKQSNDWEWNGKKGTSYIFVVCHYGKNGITTADLNVQETLYNRFPDSKNVAVIVSMEFTLNGKDVYPKVVDFTLIK